MKLNWDVNEYLRWYAEWADLSVDEIKNRPYPFSMLSDWLDAVSIKVDENIVGKEATLVAHLPPILMKGILSKLITFSSYVPP